MLTPGALPREIAPGCFWLGECLSVSYQGTLLHAYNSVYLLSGEHGSVIIEAGHPRDTNLIISQLDEVLASGVVAQPRFLFMTHSETPHAGGVARLLDRYPDMMGCGDIEDLHLVYPELQNRLVQLEPGDALDLGGTKLAIVEAVLRDMPRTRWAFDTSRRLLFSGDGFAYSHYHAAGQCGRLAEEVPELGLSEMTAFFSEAALYWTRFCDLDPYISRLEAMIFSDLNVSLIAPTHGLPIGKPAITFPAIRHGLLLGKAGSGN